MADRGQVPEMKIARRSAGALVGLILLGGLAGCVSKRRAARGDARVKLGAAYLIEGNTEAAIQTLQEACKIDKRNVQCFNKLGLALVKRGEFEGAEKAFKRAVRLDRKNAEVNLNFAFMLQKLGRTE